MSANGIAHLATKQARQIAKLNLSANNRAASAARTSSTVADDRHTYLLSELPTVYSGNTATIQSHPGGLIQGRPWIAYSNGVYQTHYTGYWNGDPTFFNTATSTGHAVVENFTIVSEPATTSESFLGYFRADYTGTWTFNVTDSDDYTALWIGTNAVTGYTIGNALLNALFPATPSATINLVAGTFYPIRVYYGNNGGPGACGITYSNPDLSTTADLTGRAFYNPVTNGF